MQFCIFEDLRYRNFFPLVCFRPVYDLRCGALTLREKIVRALPRGRLVLQCRESIAGILAEDYPDLPVNRFDAEDTWFISGRLLAGDDLPGLLKTKPARDTVFSIGDDPVAAFIRGSGVRDFAGGLLGETIASDRQPAPEGIGSLVGYPWDLVHRSGEEIIRDFRSVRGRGAAPIPRQAAVLGRKNIRMGTGAVIKPGVVLDASEGPIILGNGVTLMPNSVIQGPAFVGDRSVLKIGARIYPGTSVGAHCKVGGEVAESVIQSYSNKQHDGFLGHSYLGSWVNIGADTNTSDLKNTYGTVRVRVDGRTVDTGLQFVGLTMGDHAKTGINVMFDTGSVVGISCNIFGPGLPPKFIPSFSWGTSESLTAYRLEESLETARRAMARRDVVMSRAYEEVFRSLFERRGSE